AALTLRQQVLSPDHPAIAISSLHLGRLYEATLDFEQAQSAYEQTLRILTSAWGNAHPSAVDALSDVGRISLKRGCRARASECMQRVMQFRLREVASAAIVQSERRQLATVSRLRGSLDAWLSISAPREEEDDSLQGVESTYEGVFAWKGQVLTRQRHVRLSSLEEELVPRFNELQAVTTTLASVSRAYPDDPRREGAWRIQMQRLLEERERREIELKQQSRIYREATGDVTVTDLRRLLPHRTVVIDFLEYKQSVCIDKERDVWTHQPCLVGFVVPATEMGHRIARIELGSVRPIAEAIAAWREGGYGATLEAAAAIATLRQLIWEPLLPYIEQADTILLSPDGVLGRLPFAVLPGRRPGSYLIEDHRLAFVPAARLLCDLLSRPKSSHSSHGLLMIGDVNYDVASDLQSGTAAQDRTLPVDQLAVSLETNHSYGTLPGTRREIDFVRQSFEGTFNSAADRTISLTGVEATERRFRQEVSAYRYVHIATHGFFAPPERVSALEGFRSDLDGSSGSDSVDDELGSRLHVIHGTMPQLLSGLVFAGANRSPLPGRDDGILTAEEIAYIPLDRVDLVVLSACETGLGAAAGGEGLLGVQRAFQVAGARSTVATLWKIDDLVTQKLMSKFYENLWGKRMSKLDALRQAQLWILKNPDQLRDLTSDVRGVVRSDVQQPRQSPAYYWASFTLSGDWR
ncbi:MAG: CHAT domain-containing protein, partial [Planctomycetaceae bacterium]|nr:CHAT domain-containing protein [Planctomycetaceae bacterium]